MIEFFLRLFFVVFF